MAHILQTIPNLTKTINKNNEYHFPENLSLWEIILNQRFSPEYLEERRRNEEIENLIADLLHSLHSSNSLFITDPETGEILYYYNTQNGQEWKEEGFALLLLTDGQVSVC